MMIILTKTIGGYSESGRLWNTCSL